MYKMLPAVLDLTTVPHGVTDNAEVSVTTTA